MNINIRNQFLAHSPAKIFRKLDLSHAWQVPAYFPKLKGVIR